MQMNRVKHIKKTLQGEKKIAEFCDLLKETLVHRKLDLNPPQKLTRSNAKGTKSRKLKQSLKIMESLIYLKKGFNGIGQKQTLQMIENGTKWDQKRLKSKMKIKMKCFGSAETF